VFSRQLPTREPQTMVGWESCPLQGQFMQFWSQGRGLIILHHWQVQTIDLAVKFGMGIGYRWLQWARLEALQTKFNVKANWLMVKLDYRETRLMVKLDYRETRLMSIVAPFKKNAHGWFNHTFLNTETITWQCASCVPANQLAAVMKFDLDSFIA
jgi:hypothetical protein